MDLFKKFVKRIDDDFGYDNEKLARDLQKIAEEHQALQLLQTGVVGRSEQLCDFEHHNADIRRAYTCSECGGRKLK